MITLVTGAVDSVQRWPGYGPGYVAGESGMTSCKPCHLTAPVAGRNNDHINAATIMCAAKHFHQIPSPILYR